MSLAENYQSIQARIGRAAAAASRDPSSIRLIGVSKKQPAQAVRTLAGLGLDTFGENYLQEAQQKATELADLALDWHFIGHLQSNKAKLIAQRFSWVHSVTSEKIAQRLNDHRGENLKPLNVCISVNLDDESSKHGVPMEQVLNLARVISGLPQLRLRGLMTIPAPRSSYQDQFSCLMRMPEQADHLRSHGIETDTLSMGMSNDLEAAIACGATHVRIGTALFGARPAP